MAPPIRRSHLAQVLIAAACSSASPSTSTGAVTGVYAVTASGNCDTECVNQSIAGAALGSGVVWLTRATDMFANCNGGSCNSPHTYTTDLDLGRFVGDGGLTQVEAPSVTSTQYLSSDVSVTPDGTQVYFAYVDPTTGSPMLQPGLDAGFIALPGPGAPGEIIGMAAQPQRAVVAVSPPASSGCNGSCALTRGTDDPSDNLGGGGGNANADGGVVWGVNLVDGGQTPQPAVFDTTFSIHLFASDGTNVYWMGGGQVSSAPLDLSSVGSAGSYNATDNCNGSTCTTSAPTGLAAAGGVVAWSLLTITSDCNFSPCTFTTSQCQVFTQTQLIFQTNQACLGLAVDAKAGYAYLGLVEDESVQNGGTGPDGGPNYSTNLYTTAIARISLLGPSTQPAAMLPLPNDRFYGPRRFFVDDTYLYGVDPAFVLRIAKSAFP